MFTVKAACKHIISRCHGAFMVPAYNMGPYHYIIQVLSVCHIHGFYKTWKLDKWWINNTSEALNGNKFCIVETMLHFRIITLHLMQSVPLLTATTKADEFWQILKEVCPFVILESSKVQSGCLEKSKKTKDLFRNNICNITEKIWPVISVRFTIFGLNCSFALKKREIKHLKAEKWGANIRLCKGDQIQQNNDPIFNTSALLNVAKSFLGCLRPICSFSITIASFFLFPFFFFQMISSTSHGTKPLFFPLATRMKPLRSHSLLTQIWRRKGFSFKAFQCWKYNHTWSFTKKQIHPDTESEKIHITINSVHAITAYLFRISSSGFASPENKYRGTWKDGFFPTGFYLHWELLVLSLKWISTYPDLGATAHMIGAKWPEHRWGSVIAKDSTCPSFRVIWPCSLQPMNVLLHLNTRSPAWTRCAKAAGKKPILSSITPWKIKTREMSSHVDFLQSDWTVWGGIFVIFM